jgi:PadR family transcriptional regulator, regulatory protein PadR
MPENIAGLELAVLVTVARLGEDAYGAAVRRALSAREERDYSIGAVYTTLQRLEDKGLLRSWSDEPRAERGGRSRRYFALTRGGAAACRVAQARHERMLQDLRLARRAT